MLAASALLGEGLSKIHVTNVVPQSCLPVVDVLRRHVDCHPLLARTNSVVTVVVDVEDWLDIGEFPGGSIEGEHSVPVSVSFVQQIIRIPRIAIQIVCLHLRVPEYSPATVQLPLHCDS
ncbi:hypothetical protein PMAYCL1PPCAC_29085 [Pristionchus mayeri]|uniref:Uncharacterized protein n=1 Tax=Pristionchus mayeri TaxID=1317129 RepID=A0AAN5IDR9_9BILA|nr:hypothetical protein PMAYCL1PPCAC_29085 [Pristionchus mayeri]